MTQNYSQHADTNVIVYEKDRNESSLEVMQ